MNLLALGSIVRLKGGTRKLMVISRVPLYNDHGKIGYFDYAGCVYPNGQNGQETLFFNEENIEEVCFYGFEDEEETAFRTFYEKQMKQITYPKLKIDLPEEKRVSQ
ncbi:MAG: DUF4176 domain-containing protein [Lachnospiraceae bacterium]|nr:DUF4176 domain-containing protein [Lachnospiraceae bacterium]